MEFKGLKCRGYDGLPTRVREIADLLNLTLEFAPTGNTPEVRATYTRPEDALAILRQDCSLKIDGLQTPDGFSSSLYPGSLNYTHLNSGLGIVIPLYNVRTSEKPVLRDDLELDDSRILDEIRMMIGFKEYT